MTEENNNLPVSENFTVNAESKQAVNEHKNLRAFFVSYASSKEEAQAIAEGRAASSHFIPLFAENEQVAGAFLHDQINNGMVLLSFEPLEALEMKTFMLRNIAEKNGINIQRQKMYDGRLLLIDHPPVQLYDARSQKVETQPEDAQPEEVESVQVVEQNPQQ